MPLIHWTGESDELMLGVPSVTASGSGKKVATLGSVMIRMKCLEDEAQAYEAADCSSSSGCRTVFAGRFCITTPLQ